MVCSFCSGETKVTNSRPQKRANNIWRRRKCQACGLVFSTIEQIDYEKTWTVHKLVGHKVPFLRDQLFTSLYKSVQHRPDALQDALGLTGTVLGKLQKIMQDGQVPSPVIATLSHETLQRFDKAAATMYAAYHADVL